MKTKMKTMKTLSGLAVIVSILTPVSAALTATGDIAFTAYDPTTENFAFVALVDINATESIFFDDEEWNGTAFGSATSEGNARWINDSGATIPAGTIITITDAGNNAGGTANIGSVSEVNGGFNLATVDGVFAYIGTDRTPTAFLAGIGDADSTSGLTSLTGTGLTLGLNALDTDSKEFIEYTGPRVGLGDLSNYRSSLTDLSNWTVTPAVATGTFNTASFGAAVPEPSGLTLLALGSAGLAARRKRRDKELGMRN